LCHFIPVQERQARKYPRIKDIPTNILDRMLGRQRCASVINSNIGSSMVLYMIGLGLGDADDITVKGLKVRK
jgi:hypothetical protein